MLIGLVASAARPFERALGSVDVDLVGELGHFGQYGDHVVGDREEAAVYRRHDRLAVGRLHPYRTGLEHAEHRNVPRQDAQLAVEGARDHHRGRS
jgi:hypothetical protein